MAEKRGDKAAWPGAGGETDQADRKGSKMAVTKLDSGLGGGEIAAKGRDYQDGTTKDTLCHLSQQATELIQQAREEGKREAREDMEGSLAQWYMDTDQLVVQLRAIIQDIQNRQLAMSRRFPGIGCGKEVARKKAMPSTLQLPLPIQRPASINRPSSVESYATISKEESAGTRMARVSCGSQLSSSTSYTVDPEDTVFVATTQGTATPELVHSTTDEGREEPASNDTHCQEPGRCLSSSDEQCGNNATGLELHPRKRLASQKKKGKV